LSSSMAAHESQTTVARRTRRRWGRRGRRGKRVAQSGRSARYLGGVRARREGGCVVCSRTM